MAVAFAQDYETLLWLRYLLGLMESAKFPLSLMLIARIFPPRERVLAVVIIGGGSLSGGRGTVAGAFMGALFMGVLNNIMILGDVNVYYQSIVIGIVLIAAVSLDVLLQRRFRG